jgi:hypothetical protein
MVTTLWAFLTILLARNPIYPGAVSNYPAGYYNYPAIVSKCPGGFFNDVVRSKCPNGHTGLLAIPAGLLAIRSNCINVGPACNIAIESMK